MSWLDQLFHSSTPGHNPYQATPFQNAPGAGYNPGAFQGGWNQTGGPGILGGGHGGVGGGVPGAFTLQGLAGQANGAQGMRAPGFDQSQQGLTGLAGMLMNQATGQGPSLAQEQLKQATQTNVANQMAMAGQTRGENPAMQGYQSAQQAGQLNQQAAGQGVQAGIQERLGAMGQLGQTYGQIGGQGMQQQQMNNQLQEYFTSQGMSAEQAQLQAQIAQQQMLAGSYGQAQGINAGVASQNANANANFIGGALGAVGSFGSSVLGGLSHGGVTGYARGGVTGYCAPGMASGGIAGDAFQGLETLGASIAGQAPPAQPQGGGGGGGGLGKLLGGGGGAPAGAASGPAMTGAESAATSGAAGAAGGAGAAAAADAPLLMLLADEGTVVPGVDRGVDERAYMLRPNEVVTPPENPMHPYVKAAQQDPAYASALAYHLLRSGIQAPTGPSVGHHGNMAGVGSGHVGYDINAGGAG